MSSFTAAPAPSGLQRRLRVPGDKSISHRALLLAARAEGRSRLRGLSGGEDVARTAAAVVRYGAAVEEGNDGEVLVDGGVAKLVEPDGLIDVGNSGTAIRLLAGWASALDGLTVLAGDASIAGRPMDRVALPLRAMGALIDGRLGGSLPPLVIRGGELHGIDYRLPVPSAQVKGAILLAGLAATGHTTVREDLPTRTHSEELLQLAGADIVFAPGEVTIRPSTLRPFDLDIPGDPSQAAFWIVAACITPGSEVGIEHVYVGAARTGFVDVLRRMGADIEISDMDDETSTATITARYSKLSGTDVGGAEIPSLVDEIPVLAVAGAYAQGTTTFCDAAELKVKESDRIATVVAALVAAGGSAEPLADGLVVHGSGGRPLAGGTVDSGGDHRVAMALAVAALASDGPVRVHGWEAVATSYPGFEDEYLRYVSR